MSLFDCIAPIYHSSLRLRQASRDDVVTYLGVGVGDIVVDIGGGTGIGARSAARTSGCRAIVVDRSAGMLRQSEPEGGVSLVLGDALALPLADASVDGALCLDALHHFSDARAALSEIRRILRPGARLVVQEMDRRRASARIISLVERVAGEPGTFWTPREMTALFLAAGLSPADMIVRGRVYYAVARCRP